VKLPKRRADAEREFAAMLQSHLEQSEQGLRQWSRTAEQQLSAEERRVEKTKVRTRNELTNVAADLRMLLRNQTGARDAIQSLAEVPLSERVAATAELREVHSEIRELEARLDVLRVREKSLTSTVVDCDKVCLLLAASASSWENTLLLLLFSFSASVLFCFYSLAPLLLLLPPLLLFRSPLLFGSFCFFSPLLSSSLFVCSSSGGVFH
jgi:hypothetical protein